MQAQKESMPVAVRVMIAVVILGLCVPLVLSVTPKRWRGIHVSGSGIEVTSVAERYTREGYQVSFKVQNHLSQSARVRLRVRMESMLEGVADPEVETTEVLKAGEVKRVSVPLWKAAQLELPQRPPMQSPAISIESVEVLPE